MVDENGMDGHTTIQPDQYHPIAWLCYTWVLSRYRPGPQRLRFAWRVWLCRVRAWWWMSSRIRLQSVLSNVSRYTAAYCWTNALIFPVFVRSMLQISSWGSQEAVEWGWGRGLESEMIRFLTLAGSVLPSSSTKNFSYLFIRVSSESRLTLLHATRYSYRFDYTFRLRVLRSWMASYWSPSTRGLSCALLEYLFRPLNFQFTVIELNMISTIALVNMASAES